MTEDKGLPLIWRHDPPREVTTTDTTTHLIRRLADPVGGLDMMARILDAGGFTADQDMPNVSAMLQTWAEEARAIIEKGIHQALDNAIENGYDLLEWSDDDISEDLHEYDSDYEEITPGDILPYVKTWREKRQT